MSTSTSQPPPLPTAVPTAKTLRRLFLMLFLRGRSARGLKKDTAPKSVARKLLFTLFFYCLFGAMATFLIGKPVFVLSFYLHAMTIGFLGMFVASSTGEVLFNKEEPDILLHRPVDARELLWAKVSVLVMVSLWLAGAFNLFGFFVGTVASDGSWRYPLVHAFSTTAEAMFCTSLVVVIFQLCLRWLGRERLDGLMTTAQVIMTMAVVISGQIVPRLLGESIQFLTPVTAAWWVKLLPPAWFAGMDDALAGTGAMESWIMASCGIIFTAILTWLAFGRLAKDYAAGLQMMNQSSTRPVKSRTGRRFLDRLAHTPPLSWWLRDSVARSSFLLVSAYLIRDRDVKLRVYPGIAPLMVAPLVFLFTGHNHHHGGSSGFESFGVAYGGAMLGLMPFLALNMLQYSDQWQASDIFRISPILGPAQICHGARRATFLLLALPVMLVYGGIVVFFSSDPTRLLLLLPGIILAPVFSLVPMLRGKAVPLSHSVEGAKAASRGLGFIGIMFLSMGMAAGASFAWNTHYYGWFLLVEFVLAIGAYLPLRAATAAARWDAI